MIPIESRRPIRRPGLLWRLETKRAATVQAFAVIVRKTALGKACARKVTALSAALRRGSVRRPRHMAG
jgi:hypothetical protein